MKRLVALFALLFGFAIFIAFSSTKSQAKDVPIQFKGYVTNYPGGSPASDGTVVQAYSGSVLQGQTTLQRGDGYYELTGSNSVFTTGTYELRVDTDDRIGVTTVYHTQGTETNADISLVPY